MQKAKTGAPFKLLERYCRNHRISFLASLLLCTLLAVGLWEHVATVNLLFWLALVLLTQAAQTRYSHRYLREQGALKYGAANWMPGLLSASVATGAAWGVSFFMLGLSGSEPIVILLIFCIAGVTAYAGIAKSDILFLGMAFEISVLLPLCAWLFLQADTLPHARYMGSIALLYLFLLYFMLRQINAMALRTHALHDENSELSEALARVQVLDREGALFRSMFEMISDPAITVHDPDDDMRIIYANAAACHHFGVDEETVLTLRPADFDVRTDAEKRALLQENLEQHGRFAFQSVHRRADGEEVPVEVITNTFEHQGGLLRVTFVRDITARLAAEQHMQALEMAAVRKEGEQRIGRYLESVPGLFFTLRRDRDGKLSMPFARGSNTSDHGLSPETVADSIEPLLALCHPDDTAPLLAELHAAAEDMRPCRVEFRIGAPTVGEMTMELTAQPQSDANDAAVMEWHGFMQDITERKRMEEELRLKEYVLDNAHDGVYLIDEHACFVYVNDQACHMLGYSRSELIGMGVGDIDYAMSNENSLAVRKKSLEEGAFTFETQHRRRDGSLLPVEVQASTMVYQGKHLGLALVRDITERKRMELALQASERDFRSLAENMPDNIARWDVEGRYLYVNPVHERLLGVAASEVIGQPLPATHEHVKSAFAQVVASGQAVELVRQTVPVNGELQSHEVTLVPEFDAAGRVVSVLGLGRNMTEFYRLQDEIAARERDFRSLAESSPDNIVRYDREGRIRYLNTALLHLLGGAVSKK